MEEIQLPLRDQVAEARLNKLAAELEAEKEHKALDKFAELVEKLQTSLEIDPTMLAAMLLKRQQGKRPLFYIGEDPMIEAIERDKQRRKERREGGRDGGRNFNNQDWDTYQLQVGREQGVQVKDIVGALANELGLGKGSIGAIKLAQGHTFVQLPKAMTSDAANKLSKLRIRQQDVGAVVCDFDDFRESRGGRRDGGRRDGGGYRGNRDGNREGGRREGGRREGGRREGGFRGNRDGNRDGNREGGERRFDRNRGGDHRGAHRGERGHGRGRRSQEA
ncbi:dbpA RNA binding domain protein [Vibrio harveyi]|uniref:DbpA RNA binding domain protein n=1 Tax=Vibrio harveyi TaxID=669 RepID=A0A454CVW6_VIBHA|nr:dbpA RNA binding domain protein [Vibrio harveyi]